MKLAIAFGLVVAALACVRIAPGAYRCDARGSCPSPFVCSRDFCVEPVVGGEGEGEGGEGEGVAGEGEGEGTSAPAFDTAVAAHVDDTIVAVSAAVDDASPAHAGIALWSHTNSPVADRLRFASCTGASCSSSTALLADNLAGAAVHPSITLDAQSRPRIVYSSGDLVFAAVCDANCAQSSSWSTVQLAVNATAPRIALDSVNGDVVALSCVGPATASVLTMHRCSSTSSCATSGDWRSTPLSNAGGCVDVSDFAIDGGRAVAMLADFDGATSKYKLREAWCASSCTSASSWSASDAPASETSAPTAARIRFVAASGAAFVDVARASLAVCSGCASTSLPSAGFSIAPLDDASLATRGSRIAIALDAGSTWTFAACELAAASSCSSFADFLGSGGAGGRGVTLADGSSSPSAPSLSLVVDAAGKAHAASASGNALSWASER